MILAIRNTQRAIRIDVRLLREVALHLLREELQVEEAEMAIHLVGPRAMARVNQGFLGHEGPTDVITFDHSPRPPRRPTHLRRLEGELYICPEVARLQAREFATCWQEELVRYVAHGMLHLCGHDDLRPAARVVMKREENRLVRRLAARFRLERLQRRATPGTKG